MGKFMADSECIEKLQKDAAKAAKRIADAENLLIVAHIDADGISSAAIAAKTCQRLGKEYSVLFANKMDDETIRKINESDRDVVWIVDLGSGYLSYFKRDNIVVTDHHVPDPSWRRGQSNLDRFISIDHVNGHSYGIDGSAEACGASTTYLVSKKIDPKNADLSYLAVVGACGDIQDRAYGKLVGVNRIALDDAIQNGDVVAENDIRLFGRVSRPLVQLIQYSNDPFFAGLSDNAASCTAFYRKLGINLKEGNRYRTWSDLKENEKETIRSELAKHVRPDEIGTFIGEVYSLPGFPRDNGLCDSKEFATTLNSCGRYDDAPTGLRICFGEFDAIKAAEENRAEHKRNISSALQFVKDNDLVKIRKYIQYFDAGTSIKDTVVGIVAGMILNAEGYRKDLPIIAFADSSDGVKVSARADRSLGERGLDLSIVMNRASKLVGGYGGGHNVAAGATIPPENKERFLDIVEDIVSSQII